MKKNFLIFIITFPIVSILAQQKSVFTIQAGKPTAEIASTMWGLFFEDINMGADGGIYAELVKNRSFEFSKPLMGWTIHSQNIISGIHFGSELLIVNQSEKEATNPRFMQVTLNKTIKGNLGLTNEGFRGMGIKKGLHYDFSVLYRQQTTNAKMYVELVSEKGDIIGSGIFIPGETGDGWHKGEMNIIATATDAKAKLNIWFEGSGALDIDMLSLFPADTWKGRKGGLRADMVQMLADFKPGFIRFPGGCIVEGRDLSTRYQWKKTIGPVEDRKLIISRWNNEITGRHAPDYFQTFGLGFFEYFQLSEDVGAEPLPIINCGMACQFNTAEVAAMEDLDPYVQDALDLIEFANGAVDTKWGKVRAGLGHPASFNLKMLGVGNENWGPQYIERLKVFQEAINKKYPEIKLICSSGIMPDGELFDFLNSALRKMKVGFIDEHYYSSPKWFLDNTKRYDSYDRKSVSKVFVGEYAAQSDRITSADNKNNWLTALTEAAFLTGLERNADVVQMASYAPLFGHVDGWQWKPDLIWVDNLQVLPTPNYFVQKLYATNKGSQTVSMLNKDKMPVTGQDSLYASSTLDKTTNELIIKIVNVAGKIQLADLNIEGVHKVQSKAKLTVLQSDNLNAENSFDTGIKITP
ncbi:MAG: alpha-L-arabinofuranosidase C-terminal domain-containing protein, partial [Chitinophagaceae bacterium]